MYGYLRERCWVALYKFHVKLMSSAESSKSNLAKNKQTIRLLFESPQGKPTINDGSCMSEQSTFIGGKLIKILISVQPRVKRCIELQGLICTTKVVSILKESHSRRRKKNPNLCQEIERKIKCCEKVLSGADSIFLYRKFRRTTPDLVKYCRVN